ncbi:MAG: helix-turn-helix domain-containing protein [Kiritimatiellae bacterium]|nr:helix-turn-helix domain-containing protein [Kiritimatiellia bacterium]
MTEGIPNARFLGIGRHEPRLPWHMAAHSHPFQQMIVVMRGGQKAALCGRTLAATEGGLLFYPANRAHEEWTEPGQTLLSFFVDFEWELCPPDVPLHVADTDSRIRVLAGWLYRERERRSPLSAATNEAVLQTLLLEFVRLWRYGEGDMVERVRRHARGHMAEPLSLARLARHAGLSKYHFARKYRRLTGRTPVQDVRQLRLDFARDLILTTSRPLKEIAPEAGLGDVYHMSRLFRRYLGITPGSLRRGV